jgi:replication-associated recombination protein RarA
LSAHSQVETILLADREAKKGLTSYTDEYYDRFYNLTAAALIKQLSEASTDVGSYWLTAWINAGRPQLPR